jgi:signal peptidase I
MSQWRARASRLVKNKREFVFLATLVFMVLVARSTLADHYHVPSGSMQPTLRPGDHVVVNKLAYGVRVPFSHTYLSDFDGPARGDVVVLDSPETGETLIKRVVAVPGDRVMVRGGQITLNGVPVPVQSTSSGWSERLDASEHRIRLSRGGGPDFGPMTLPPSGYLVMGDNRGASHDGRIFGLVHRGLILGRAIGVFLAEEGFTWRPM